MKPVLLSLLLLISTNSTISDAQRMGFKGKVKEVLEITFYASTSYSYQDRYFFDKQGNLQMKLNYETHTDFDDSQTLIPGDTMFYKKENGITHFKSQGKRPNEIQTGSIEQIGKRIFKTIYKDESASFSSESISHYDKKNNLIKMERRAFFNSDSMHYETIHHFKNGKIDYYVMNDFVKNTKDTINLKNIQYDEFGNVLSTDFYVNNQFDHRYSYEYIYY
jgi:hypothetical protein